MKLVRVIHTTTHHFCYTTKKGRLQCTLLVSSVVKQSQPPNINTVNDDSSFHCVQVGCLKTNET